MAHKESYTGNILIIGDTHLPFEHRDYLDFCYQTKKKYKCSLIYHVGDVADFHAISRHPHNPDGFSPKDELEHTRERLKDWIKAFPKCSVCMGNHDERVEKAAWNFGLSAHYFKNLPEILGFPKAWDYQIAHYINRIRIFHGMGYGGKMAHVNAVLNNQSSIVIGHLHSNSGVESVANEDDLFFGMAVGCGIDRHSYAFNYGRDIARKPILSCGVILEGRIPMVVPMKL